MIIAGLYWDIKILICNALFGGVDNLALHMEFYARAVTYVIISIILGLGLWLILSIGLSVRRIFKVDFLAQIEDRPDGRGRKRGKR